MVVHNKYTKNLRLALTLIHLKLKVASGGADGAMHCRSSTAVPGLLPLPSALSFGDSAPPPVRQGGRFYPHIRASFDASPFSCAHPGVSVCVRLIKIPRHADLRATYGMRTALIRGAIALASLAASPSPRWTAAS